MPAPGWSRTDWSARNPATDGRRRFLLRFPLVGGGPPAPPVPVPLVPLPVAAGRFLVAISVRHCRDAGAEPAPPAIRLARFHQHPGAVSSQRSLSRFPFAGAIPPVRLVASPQPPRRVAASRTPIAT